MRSIVTKGGIPTFVSSEEYNFLESIGDVAYKKDLTERHAELARMLTSRGVLQRFSDADRGIYFTRNINKGIE